ncbi:MAG: 1-acyl-sn-glycerol-3-phosphate acyltransferase [Deltaproteobacteria bacterium]|nr:1-acyl-sn-glycerol-3-phosphate acyltransferase [Deltaproteobacteria bacterium]
MSETSDKRGAGTFVEGLAKAACFTFFRSIEVTGEERIPRGVPLVLVSNHHNSLVDPILVLGTTGVHARFLAKATLWQVPFTRLLLKLAKVIPVYRAQDGSDMSKNDETFRACWSVLAEGGAIALFPEGISHDAPHLARLKTGAARIVLGAASELGVRGTQIVPVGLTFEQKGKFRSRSLVTIGAPLDPAPFIASAASDEAGAVRDLTAAVRSALEAVTLNYPKHEDVPVIDQASALWAERERDLPARMALEEAFQLRSTALRLYERAKQRYPHRVAALTARVENYQHRLAEQRLRDEHVAAKYPREEVIAYAIGSATLLFFWLPIAALGSAMNWIPYRIIWAGARLTPGENLPATVKLLGGFFLYPITWLVWAFVAGGMWGWAAGVATFLLGPLAAWFAMLFHERYEHFWEHARAWATVKLRPAEAAKLKAEREALHREMRAIAEDSRETRDERR